MIRMTIYAGLPWRDRALALPNHADLRDTDLGRPLPI